MKRVLSSMLWDIQGALPEGAGKAFQRGVWRVQGRPKVHRDPEQHLPRGLGKGSVTFSLDFELAWAWRYSKGEELDCRAIGLRERAQFPKVLAAFDDRRMPATWAVVGHLFLDRCRRGADGRAHPEIPPVPPFESRWWKYDGPDWFAHDPCSDLVQDPAWYAPDLIAMLKASRTGHEIGCHSFSHLGLGPYCPHEVALADLRACREVMQASGLEVRSFVHPGNDYGNFAALKEAGFSIFRMFPWSKGEVSLPVLREDGLWLAPAAACLQMGDDVADPRRLRTHRQRLEILVDTAVATGMNAHLWLHPSITPVQTERILLPLLDYCAGLRDAGDLDVLTMDELVARTAACRREIIDPERSQAS